MKKLLLLLLLSASLQTVWGQHMHREAGDNCKLNNLWYQVEDVCESDESSQLRCDYCGLYFTNRNARLAHQETCGYRPHIEYLYDNAGNRTERKTENYHWGRRITACSGCLPGRKRTGLPDADTRPWLAMKNEEEESLPHSRTVA
ncbi:MAG: hypothetical protein IJP70_09860 [Bacteroidales bacterium]|nr:hypothetical protein [Bacteroidales bacterium]